MSKFAVPTETGFYWRKESEENDWRLVQAILKQGLNSESKNLAFFDVLDNRWIVGRNRFLNNCWVKIEKPCN